MYIPINYLKSESGPGYLISFNQSNIFSFTPHLWIRCGDGPFWRELRSEWEMTVENSERVGNSCKKSGCDTKSSDSSIPKKKIIAQSKNRQKS